MHVAAQIKHGKQVTHFIYVACNKTLEGDTDCVTNERRFLQFQVTPLQLKVTNKVLLYAQVNTNLLPKEQNSYDNRGLKCL